MYRKGLSLYSLQILNRSNVNHKFMPHLRLVFPKFETLLDLAIISLDISMLKVQSPRTEWEKEPGNSDDLYCVRTQKITKTTMQNNGLYSKVDIINYKT